MVLSRMVMSWTPARCMVHAEPHFKPHRVLSLPSPRVTLGLEVHHGHQALWAVHGGPSPSDTPLTMWNSGVTTPYIQLIEEDTEAFSPAVPTHLRGCLPRFHRSGQRTQAALQMAADRQTPEIVPL